MSLTPSLVRPDWLHTLDQGISCSLIGNLFFEVLPKLPGATVADRVTSLWAELQVFNSTLPADRRMARLTLDQFAPSGKSPQLKGKAAAIRALIPFCRDLAARHFSSGSLHDLTAVQLFEHLGTAYDCLDKFCQARLAQASRKLAGLWVALEAEAVLHNPGTKHWKVKPKLHLVQELCELGGAYRDEGFGGALAAIFRRCGGHDSPGSNTWNALFKWAASNSTPQLR